MNCFHMPEISQDFDTATTMSLFQNQQQRPATLNMRAGWMLHAGPFPDALGRRSRGSEVILPPHVEKNRSSS